jgi:hypothetical protein
MKRYLEQGGVSPGFKVTDENPEGCGRRRSSMRQFVLPRGSAVAPVRYLRGEATLRTYRAQSDQWLRLYDRGRAEGLYGRARVGDGEDMGCSSKAAAR